MSGSSVTIPEGYEILSTIDTSGSVGEYVARHKADDVLVRLRIFNFSQTSSATTRRHLREHLRCDISFMEELEQPGVIRIFDYSDTKKTFWIATEPAKVDKLSKRFDFLASESLEFRQGLALQFLAALGRIHNSGVVHRNLSGDAIFLSSKMEIYIGDFGFASYITDQPTGTGDTSSVTTLGYQPPEVRNAATFSCDVSCDIFSAGLLVFEILSAIALPKDDPGEIYEVLSTCLNEQVARDIINSRTAEVILRAANPSPEKRWPSVEDFASALEESLQGRSIQSSISVDPSSTIAIAKPVEPSATVPIQPARDAVQKLSQPIEGVTETAGGITPLDRLHEIWNNRYEILEKIGEGGQAIVYKAYDHLTNEEIAIKTIWSRHREDRSAINRLKQGAMIARSLTHRHIIRTYSVEQRIEAEGAGRFVFICMELIRSQLELSDVIEARRAAGLRISLRETLHIIRQLLDALAYAHEHTIHRDIKPGNIMLVPRDERAEIDSSDLTKFDIRLIDFGIAKVLSQKHIDVTGKGFRSAHYGAPELADAKTGVDARADIFSAGVIMYQMLTKTLPRKGSPPANKVNKDVPAALAKVIDKAINADRQKRFRTVSEFTKEIDRAVSKFNWVRKAAKIAAVVLLTVCTATAVEYFLPEPDYLPVQESVELLQNRSPDRRIATLADEAVVRYSDIEGYASYDGPRQEALGGLKTAEDLGTDTFRRNYSPWKKQEEVWVEVEPAVEKIERIAEDQREYNARKDLAIAGHLMKLNPSSEIVSSATKKAERAEVLLEKRPFSQDALDNCADAYDLGAKVYTNIDILADGSDTLDTAEEINDKLKDVEKLRNSFLPTRDALYAIERLRNYDFQEHSRKCFEKADGYYQSFELRGAEKYFALLNQICGTIVSVQDQVDFSRSDIGLISSRLMELCYDNIETFENYPEWKERLEQVYKRKDVLAKYMLIRSLISIVPKDAQLSVYELAVSARQLCESGDLDSAGAKLAKATKECKESMRDRIGELSRDCDSLSAFSFVSSENIESCKIGLERLSESIDEPNWPQAAFIDEYKRCSGIVTSEKDAVRRQLIEDAQKLKNRIVDSGNEARAQDFFWESRRISEYIAVAHQYDTDDIDRSIEAWQSVDNLDRLSKIINQMRGVGSHLDKMLDRKDLLDQLAKDIDNGIGFCQRFKGISSEEREKYRQFEADLKLLRSKLTTPQNNTYLIDQTDEIFTAQRKSIRSAFSEIRAKLPYHRSRLIELIEKTHFLEKNGGYIVGFQQLWVDVLRQVDVSEVRPDFSETRTYLESVKEDVDEWSTDSFNRQMQDTCKILADALDKQNQAIVAFFSAILNEKAGLINSIETFEKKAEEILRDEDIRILDDLAAAGQSPALLGFRQLPSLLDAAKQKFAEVQLRDVGALADVLVERESASFEVDTWLERFNANVKQIDAQISQSQAIEPTISIFQETRQMLAQQSSTERDYYLGLRDYTVSLIDYSDASKKIDAIEADRVALKMCSFLEQMKNDTVPRFKDLKASVAVISKDLANLKSAQISTLSEAKDFNRKREELLNRIGVLRQDVRKLNRANLKVSCKQSVTQAVDKVTNLIGTPNQAETLSNLTSLLWSFFPDHKEWSQWIPFLKLYHVVLSDGDVRLASSPSLKPVTEKGNYLSLTEIAADPTEVFYNDAGDSANFGWPRYVSHQKDRTVVLAFIRSAGSGGMEPFYMATREITNAQYKLFMERAGAKSTTNLTGWSCFGDQNNNPLIAQAQGQFPPSRITWDKSAGLFVMDEGFKDAPVAWVTYKGGQAYARWLGGQLPTVPQHVYATRAGASTPYPWGDDLSNVTSHAHVRSTAWQRAARDYNAKRDNPVEIAYPPVGAVKDFLAGKALDPARIVRAESNSTAVWPCSTNNKPNACGLYDMIGNVWEWCTDMENNSTPVICGGSCLCPPEYISSESKYEFEAQACDVGFRIVIPAK